MVLVLRIVNWFGSRKFLKRAKKYSFFIRKMEHAQKKIWEIEFLRENLKSMREGIRIQYDRVQENLDAAKIRQEMELKKEDPDKTIKESLQKSIDKFTLDSNQFLNQMQGLDAQIEGEEGTNKGIESYHSVLQLLKDHIKKI